MPAETRRIIPARLKRMWETASASPGTSRTVWRKYFDQRIWREEDTTGEAGLRTADCGLRTRGAKAELYLGEIRLSPRSSVLGPQSITSPFPLPPSPPSS